MKLPDHKNVVEEVLEELGHDATQSGDIMHADDYLRVIDMEQSTSQKAVSSSISD